MAWPVCDGRRRARPAAQLGRLAGESMEFMDHREYQPGDDLRRLDWAAYARSDKMIVKLYRQEVCPHLDIVLDGSRSMALPDSEKLHASLALAAALSTAAGNTGHSHRVYLTGQGCRPVANGGEQPLLWQGLTFDLPRKPARIAADPAAGLATAWHSRDCQRPALARRSAGIADGYERPGSGGLCDPGAGRGRRGPAGPRRCAFGR